MFHSIFAKPATRRPRRVNPCVEQLEVRDTPAMLNLLVQVTPFIPEPIEPPTDVELPVEIQVVDETVDPGVIIGECVDPMPGDLPDFVEKPYLPGDEPWTPPEQISIDLGTQVMAVGAEGEEFSAKFTLDVSEEAAALGWVRMDLYRSDDAILDDQDVMVSSEGTFTWLDENGEYQGEFYPYLASEDIGSGHLIAKFTAETPMWMAYGRPVICTMDGNPEWAYRTLTTTNNAQENNPPEVGQHDEHSTGPLRNKRLKNTAQDQSHEAETYRGHRNKDRQGRKVRGSKD